MLIKLYHVDPVPHYDNMPMNYSAIFHGYKNDNF